MQGRWETEEIVGPIHQRIMFASTFSEAIVLLMSNLRRHWTLSINFITWIILELIGNKHSKQFYLVGLLYLNISESWKLFKSAILYNYIVFSDLILLWYYFIVQFCGLDKNWELWNIFLYHILLTFNHTKDVCMFVIPSR